MIYLLLIQVDFVYVHFPSELISFICYLAVLSCGHGSAVARMIPIAEAIFQLHLKTPVY
jgi:hypothetical protein